jgi:signal transduction histidine kinase
MSGDNSDFYAALIHELKNNLGLLSMTLDTIPDTGDATRDAALDAARMQCQGVVERLQQALLVYKANQGRLIPTIDAYSPHDLVDELTRRAEGLAHGRVQVVSEVAADVPPIGFFDRDLVEMALINAVHNSLVYARSGIRIEAGMQDGCLEFSVRDDSEGFPAHILASLADGTPYRARGTGLGLQFARLIAEAHENRGRHGALRLANDGGAVFSLIVP